MTHVFAFVAGVWTGVLVLLVGVMLTVGVQASRCPVRMLLARMAPVPTKVAPAKCQCEECKCCPACPK